MNKNVSLNHCHAVGQSQTEIDQKLGSGDRSIAPEHVEQITHRKVLTKDAFLYFNSDDSGYLVLLTVNLIFVIPIFYSVED